MGRIKITRQRCKGCRLCISSCPKGLIALDKSLNKRGVYPVYFGIGKHIADTTAKIAESYRRRRFSCKSADCTGCSFCALVCPECCIEVYK